MQTNTLRSLFLLSFLLLASFLFSCDPTEEIPSTDNSIQLSFSADTIYFDTLISTLQSTTFRFRAYNPSNNALNISRIALGMGELSAYSVTINGVQGPVRENVRLLGGDSLLVLISANVDAQNMDLPYIVKDSIVFETNGHRQDVKLVAWGQEANFLRDSVIDCNTVWGGNRPYVIYDDVLIDSACSLTLEAGTTVYMHNGANFFIRGSINSLGSADAPVTFTSIRQDEPYDKTPGQWGAIVFLGSSQNNFLQYTCITNGLFGIYLDPATSIPTDVTLEQCKIENMAFAGLWSFGGTINMTNCLINNCLANTVACIAGGTYTFDHCTFANYGFNFFREEPSMVLTNFAILEGRNGEITLASDLRVHMRNSILWGSLNEELRYPEQLAGFDSTVILENCFVRSALAGNFPNSQIQNTDPLFIEPALQNFRLDTLSPAKNMASPIGVMIDISGRARDSKPDIGAYERVE